MSSPTDDLPRRSRPRPRVGVEVAVPPLETRLEELGAGLQRSLSAVLEALPGPPRRPADLVRSLEVNRDIAGRVLRAAGAVDPLECLHLIPGPQPLRQVLRTAESIGVPATVVAGADAAVDAFDRAIRREGGTRGGLDALVATRMPDVRRRHEQSSKQAVFRGMRQLRGAYADTWLSTTLLFPSRQDPSRLDHLQVHGAIGLRMLRPGARVKFTYREFGSAGAAVTAAGPPTAVDLGPFLRHPAARLEARVVDQVVHYVLAETEFGPQRARDMLVAEHHEAALDRYRDPDAPQRRGAFVAPSLPVEALVFDVFLHDEIFPASEVDLEVYDTGSDGIVNVNDPTRAEDCMDIEERLELLGGDPRRFDAVELPRYVPMLESICERLDQRLDAFRGYRCRVQYPVPGWQVCMSFRNEPPPGA